MKFALYIVTLSILFSCNNSLLTSHYVTKEVINTSECLYVVLSYLDDEKYDHKARILSDLLLSYGAIPTTKCLLKAAGCDIAFLNKLIDQYNGVLTQENNKEFTVLHTAFNSNILQNFDEINYINKLSDKEKKEFIRQELVCVAHLFPGELTGSSSKDTAIKKLFDFVSRCIDFGAIDMHEKIDNNATLLEVAYQVMKTRLDNYTQYKCMYNHTCNKLCGCGRWSSFDIYFVNC